MPKAVKNEVICSKSTNIWSDGLNVCFFPYLWGDIILCFIIKTIAYEVKRKGSNIGKTFPVRALYIVGLRRFVI